jgi:hypothetical protein
LVDIPYFEEISRKYQSKPIEFWIDPLVRTNGSHWWLPIICEEVKSIRIRGGGKPQPEHPFHLTIGLATGLQLEKSILAHKSILFHKSQHS